MAFLKKYKWVLASVVAALCLLTALWVLLPRTEERSAALPAEATTTATTTLLPTEDSTEDTTTATTILGDATQSETEEPTTSTTAMVTTTAAPKVKLTVTSHPDTESTTDESITTFTGTSDPKHPLTINGKAVERDKLGAFSVEYTLKPGRNTFTFSHKNKKTTYIVNYRYVVMQSYTPSGSRRYNSGAKVSVVVTARVGSTVTATFRGKTVTLSPAGAGGDEEDKKSETFVRYAGTFTLPSGHTADRNLGAITFKATCQGQTDTGRSGNIICNKEQKNVVAEVVAFTAETFDGDKSDDNSRPTNNYFPKGTVDYVVGHTYYGEKEYLLLRCGRRIYVKRELTPPKQTVMVAKEYAASLPDTNKLSLDSLRVTGDATYITLNTDWKAPFFLDLLPQKYRNPSAQEYEITSMTAQYVEITFCYATSVTGKFTFSKDHPLFTKATVQKSGDNTVLRLYLRRTGGFYGWDATYNDKGQLEFYFLHPAQVRASNNAYGANLTGVKVMLDVGHGPKSVGTAGLDSDHPEHERNYYLALLVKKELESVGATVVLNRSASGDLNADERCWSLKNYKPDICIAIHHDANVSSRPNGFGSFYSLPFSYEAARQIYNATMAAGIYASSAAGNRNRLEWHYYFTARMSYCPVVLTENGYMTSPVDHPGIVSDTANWKKAQAIARGVAKYFLSIRLLGYVPPTSSTTTKNSVTTTTTARVTSTAKTTTTTLSSKSVIIATQRTTTAPTTTTRRPTTTEEETAATTQTTTTEESTTEAPTVSEEAPPTTEGTVTDPSGSETGTASATNATIP